MESQKMELKHLLRQYEQAVRPKWKYQIDDSARGTYSADIDNDNFEEVLIGAQDRVHVLSHYGRPKWEYTCGGKVWSTYALDIDNDGYKEVIVGCLDAHVYVLGCGGNLKWKFKANDEVWAVYAADIDNDGHVEILAGCWDHTIYVLDDKGHLKQIFKAKDEVKSIFASDIDNDGQVEILAGCHDGSVSMLDRNGQVQWTFETNDAIRGIQCTDINNDQFAEVIVGSRDRSVYVLNCKGTMKWEFRTDGPLENVCCVDADGDGQLEVVAGSRDNHFYIIEREGRLLWKQEVKGVIWYLHASDIDADGSCEIVVSTREGTVLALPSRDVLSIIQQVKSLYEEVGENIHALGLTPQHQRILSSIVAGHRDQDLRAVMPAPLKTAIDVYKHGEYLTALDMLLKLRHFPFEVTMTYHTGRTIRGVCYTYDGNSIRVVFGGLDRFVSVLDEKGIRWRYGADGWVFNVSTLDLNRDGQKEVIAGSRDGYVYVLDENGQLEWKYRVGNYVWSVHCADINNDGDIEVIAGGNDACVHILDYRGNLLSTIEVDDKMWCVTTADLAGDGHREIIICCWSGCVYAWNYQTNQVSWKFDLIQDEIYSVHILPTRVERNTQDHFARIIVGAKDGFVYALDARGVLRWRQRIGSPVRGLTSMVNNASSYGRVLLVGSEDGYLHWLNLEGTVLQKHDLGNFLNSIFASNEDKDCPLVVGFNNGFVKVFQPIDEQELAKYILLAYTALNGKDELNLLARLSKHESKYIRGYAAERIAALSLENPEALDLFEEIARDKDAYVRAVCATALSGSVDLTSVRPSRLLQRFVDDNDPQARLALVSGLKDIARTKPVEGFKIARRLLKDKDDHVRRDVVRSLGSLSTDYPSQTFSLLIAAVHDQHDWFRHEVARSLADYFDAHPHLLLKSSKALFSYACPLEILDCISTLACNGEVRRVLQSYRDLLENTDEATIGRRLEEARATFARLTDWAHYGKEVYGLYKSLQELYSLRSVEEIVTAWPLSQELPKPEEALYPQAIQALTELGKVVSLLARYLEREALGDRLAYLIDAVNVIERLQREAGQRFQVTKDSKYTYPERIPFELLLSHWRELVRLDLAKLRGKAEMQLELKTKRSPFEQRVTLVLEMRNIGRSPADNLRVQLKGEEGYTILGEDHHHIEYVPSQETVIVEFTISPTMMTHRIPFELTYDDAEGRNKTLTFADRIEFFAVSQEFVPITNPYVAGKPIKSSQMFFGRQDLLDYLRLNLSGHADNIIVLHGERRSGKSSIVYQLLNTPILAPHIPILIDMQGLMDVDTSAFFYRLARRIFQGLQKEDVKAERFQISDFAYNPTIVFDDFLDEVERELGGRKIILMFDEFELLEQKVRSGKISQDLFGYIRSLMQHRTQINFIFTGTHTLQLLSRDYWSIFFNIALHRKISFLDKEAGTDLITKPVAGQFEYDPLAVEKIHQLTAAHPYFIQLICHSLVNHCNHKKMNYVTITDVNTVLKEVMLTGQDHFQYVWSNSSVQERLALTAIAYIGGEQGHPVSLADLGRTYGERGLAFDEETARGAMRSLVERDILEETPGRTHFRITIDLIRRWLRETKPYEQVVRDELKNLGGGIPT